MRKTLSLLVLAGCNVASSPPEHVHPPSDGLTLCELHAQVIQGSCVSCHQLGMNPPDLSLESMKTLVGAPSLLYPGATLIVPRDPDASLLYRKVMDRQSDNEGLRMPPEPAPALEDHHAGLIRDWIEGGANTDCIAATKDAGAPDTGEIAPDAGPPDAGPPPMVSGLILEVTFEEGSGQVLRDTSDAMREVTLGQTDQDDPADPAWAEGAVGNGLFFDGNNDYARVADFPPPESLTVMAWVKPEDSQPDPNDDRIILNKNNEELDFRIGGDGYFGAAAGGVALRDQSFDFTAAENRALWYHLAYTFDATADVHVLYRDGIEVARGPNTSALADTDDELRIGRHSQFDFGTFLGAIDQVRLYDRALTPEEIRMMHDYERVFVPGPVTCDEQTGLDIYQRRIEPLVIGGKPATCNQCHLSGIELAAFVQDTPCQSMACLVATGLVDLQNPAQSSILQQIRMAQPDSELITDQVIQAEYDGFLSWIEWSATCQEAACGEIADPCNSGNGTTPPPDDVVDPLGQCSEQALGTAFFTQVYSSRGRCAGCHDPTGPRFMTDAPVYIDPSGDLSGALNTMYNLIGLGDVDANAPANSLLLLKPLNQVEHGGGPKFADTSDPSYQTFLGWLTQYSACVSSGNLPPAPQTPSAGILSPADGDSKAIGEAIVFIGEAIDPQDGLLTGGAVEWSSSISGVFGSAERVELPLPAGLHTITFRATDQDGNEVTDTVTLQVQ